MSAFLALKANLISGRVVHETVGARLEIGLEVAGGAVGDAHDDAGDVAAAERGDDAHRQRQPAHARQDVDDVVLQHVQRVLEHLHEDRHRVLE